MYRILAGLFISCALLCAQSGNLNIYWIDVEGGGSTLIVTPAGQSLLVDTGNPSPVDRDAKRIFEATKQAGISKIDYLLTTHFHGDHVGGAPALAKMIPIEHFLDHGDSVETGGRGGPIWEAYKTLSAGNRTILKPGDKLPIKGLEAIVVSSNGEVIAKPINKGGPNPLCKDVAKPEHDATENERSAGILLTYGKFKFLDLGDLTRDMEMELACPVNKLGTVTLFQASHHGFFNDFSGLPAHVLAVNPQVVVVNNGATKGWQNSAWETTNKIPRLEDIWQIHMAMGPGRDHNVDEKRIANPEPAAECKGFSFHASVAKDGKFTLTNARNNYSKAYVTK
jgi:competence protein ComEC